MPDVYNPYHFPVLAEIKENLSLLLQSSWQHFQVAYLEPMPPGPAFQVDMCAQATVTLLAAGGTIAKRAVTVLQLLDSEFLHIRWEPLDNIVAQLWELPGQQRFAARNVHSRVDRLTRFRDPTLASTTFGIYGQNRDANIEVFNYMGRQIPAARFQFWGYRYILDEHPEPKLDSLSAGQRLSLQNLGVTTDTVLKEKMKGGDVKVVREIIGPTRWFPASGRQ